MNNDQASPSATSSISWREVSDDGVTLRTRRVSAPVVARRKSWWTAEIGGSATLGRTYQRYLRGQCPACGPDDGCMCEGSREEIASRIMGVCARRHEDTDYDDLLARGVDRDVARRDAMESI